jgi:uncharacterized protein YigE (DUF2233 family)
MHNLVGIYLRDGLTVFLINMTIYIYNLSVSYSNWVRMWTNVTDSLYLPGAASKQMQKSKIKKQYWRIVNNAYLTSSNNNDMCIETLSCIACINTLT